MVATMTTAVMIPTMMVMMMADNVHVDNVGCNRPELQVGMTHKSPATYFSKRRLQFEELGVQTVVGRIQLGSDQNQSSFTSVRQQYIIGL